GAGAERILDAAAHVARQVGAARQHFRRRRPVRPFALRRNLLDAGPGEARAADADAVAYRTTVLLHQIKVAVRRIDDDRARLFAAGVIAELPAEARVHFVAPCLRPFRRLAARSAAHRIGAVRDRARSPRSATKQKLDEPAAELR